MLGSILSPLFGGSSNRSPSTAGSNQETAPVNLIDAQEPVEETSEVLLPPTEEEQGETPARNEDETAPPPQQTGNANASAASSTGAAASSAGTANASKAVNATAASAKTAETAANEEATPSDWAREAALATQRNERLASMIQQMSQPEAAGNLALMRGRESSGTDLQSALSAYRENGEGNPADFGSDLQAA
ncbi:hypothetical protein [Nitratireductor indicus]|uniref:hypothetical protein n=1 Tax=Nitratireductor indicus TaxID=721133 RepID=UPI0028757611|nr:hypothetical protein [Nitratireductor indicus]MDS1135835.1 hypothetical protein [Nitratireductor indicus]